MKSEKTAYAMVGTLCLALLCTTTFAQESAYDQAKAFFEQKKYDEVLKLLEKDLGKPTVTPDVLRLAMEANLLNGRPVSANLLATELLKKTQNKDLNLVYRAGEIAEICGENQLAVARYYAYVNSSKENDLRKAKALAYLLQNSSYGEITRIAAETFGPELYWKSCLDAAQRMLNQQSFSELQNMARFILTKYSDKPEVTNGLFEMLYGNKQKIPAEEQAKLADIFTSFPMNQAIGWHYFSFVQSAYESMDLVKKYRMGSNFLSTNKRPPSDVMYLHPAAQYLGSRANAESKQSVAKEIAALAPYFKNDKNALRSYIHLIVNNAAAFKSVMTPQQMAELVMAFGKPGYGSDDTSLDGGVINPVYDMFYKDDKAGRVAFLKAMMPVLNSHWFGRLQSDDPQNTKANLAEYIKAAPEGVMRDLRELDLLNSFRTVKAKNKYVKVLKSLITTGFYDPNYLNNEVMSGGNTFLTSAEKVAAVLDAAKVVGSNPKLTALIKLMAGNQTIKADAKMSELQQYANQQKAGSNAALSKAVNLLGIAADRKNAAQLNKASEEFLSQYKGNIPASKSMIRNMDEYMAYCALRHMLQVISDNQCLQTVVKQWVPRVSTIGDAWETMIQNAWNKEGNNHKGNQSYQVLKRYTELVAADRKNGAKLGFDYFLRQQINPPKQDISLLKPFYASDPQVSAAYLISSSADWTPAFFYAQVEELLKDPEKKMTNSDLLNLFNSIQNGAHKGSIPANLPGKMLEKSFETAKRTGIINYDVEMRAFDLAKKPDSVLIQGYAKLLQKYRTPFQQMNTLNALFYRNNIPFELTEATLKPLLASWDKKDWKGVVVSPNMISYLRWFTTDAKTAPEVKASAKGMLDTLSSALLSGDATMERRNQHVYSEALGENIAANRKNYSNLQLESAIGVVALSFAEETDKWRGMNNAKRIFEALKDAPSEVQYVFLSNLMKGNSNFNKEAKNTYTIQMAKLAKDISGILPVDKSDPAYDLFLATQLLKEGNALNAWALVRPKTAILRDRWKELDYDFVIWALEQTRKAKMFKEALEIAQTIWLDEQRLSAADAAKLGIIKGDIFRDNKDYPAAKIEYESLKNNQRYAKTLSGGLAKFRLVELLILTDDFPAARMILEQLIDSRSVADRVEAYYLLARLEFSQKEYAAASDYLKTVFKYDTGHLEARLLEGEVSLATNVIKDPNIKSGDRMLQTIAVPGRELIFQIQDNNLSVVRGGKSVPIIVTTSVGKDTERLELLPNANDSTLFTGSIQTALGKPIENNRLLELNGSDVIRYQIEPEFQKNNNLDYPPKELEVRSAGKLYAASKKILSEEEQDELTMNSAIAMSAGTSNRSSSNKTVRPGSPIYVRVIDPDMCKDPNKPDSLQVSLKSSSGDELNGMVLTETGPCTGIFEGKVQTGIPFPHATASDALEGVDVNAVINSTKTGSWKSLANGEKPKWLEVDTMTSNNFNEITIQVPDPKAVKNFVLTAVLDKDEDVVCTYPMDKSKNQGGLTVNVKPGNDTRLDVLDNAFKKAKTSESWIKDPVFKRELTKQKGDSSLNYQITGAFWLENNQEVTLKFLQAPSDTQYDFLFLDGKVIMGGQMNDAGVMSTRTVFLSKGIHHLKVLGLCKAANAQVIVGMLQKDGTYAPLPENWFNPDKYPAFADCLKPKAKVVQTKEGFQIVFKEPIRYRRFRWTVEDFNGMQLEVKSVSAKNEKGELILPVEQDLTTGKNNDILEIAADDQITVTYRDELNLDENKAVLSDKLSSSFHNAKITLSYEDVQMDEEGMPRTVLSQAKRVEKGDSLMLTVEDWDESTSEEQQTVSVEVTTSGGEKMTLPLLESRTMPGIFTQNLKIGETTDERTIKIEPGDTITMKYMDKENNSPGIPIYREANVLSVGSGKPNLVIYKATINMIEDKSAVAKAKIKTMRDRGDKREEIKIMKEDIEAVPVPVLSKEDAEKPIIVNSKTPLLMELIFPEWAKHSGSVAEIQVLTDSERNAAKEESRQPNPLVISAPLISLGSQARQKGYPVTLKNTMSISRESALDQGLFSAVVRLQLGAIGDEINDIVSNNDSFNLLNTDTHNNKSAFKVPTIIVSGSDRITVMVNNKEGQELARRVLQLRSNGELELFDKTYLTPAKSVHIGQNFYVRVHDPDRDVSDSQDILKVNVSASSGDKVTMSLSETLPHSGIFTGVLKTELVPKPDAEGKIAPKSDESALRAKFGDDVVFTYVDEMPLDSDKPVEVTKTGKIVIGADGEVAMFTKKFKDPDMAVKTNFLMAEALFEMAKSHRAMKKDELAKAEIARGKRILEEALRDYPNTTLKAQGEFLLANLAQQLDKFQEAIGRYSVVISTWPESDYAVKSQYQKAQCLEKLGQGLQACEEYVKLTYLYPESPLSIDAKIRLGNFYYKNGRFKSASMIFRKFSENHSAHPLAAKSLLLAGNSELRYLRDMEKKAKEQGTMFIPDYTDAISIYTDLVDKFKENPDIRAEGMYWLGDTLFKTNSTEGQAKCYQIFTQATWDYPDSKWAKIIRGRLAEMPAQ